MNIRLEDESAEVREADYTDFYLQDSDNYTLWLRGYEPNPWGLIDDYSYYHNKGFSAKDRDRDNSAIQHCAANVNSAGW